MNEQMGKCESVRDDLAAIVDGDPEALERHGDHLADCDACRDLRHEALDIARRAGDAGIDYVPPADLEARVLGALAASPAVSPGAGSAAMSSTPAVATAAAPAASPTIPGPFGPSPGSGAAPAPHATYATHGAAGTHATAPEAEPLRARIAAPAPHSAEPKAATEKPAGGKVLPFVRRTHVMVAIGAGIAAAAALAVVVATGGPSTNTTPPPVAAQAMSARILQIARAAADGATGVEIRAQGASGFAPATAGTNAGNGATIRTDGRTRARIALSDGSSLVLNHATELTLDGSTPRRVRLSQGEIVADVAHLQGAPSATFVTPTGMVEVLGTKFVLSASEDVASVRVTRGAVRVSGAAGGSAEVKAGQEGLIAKSGGVNVAPVVNLAESVAWSELGEEAPTAGAEEVVPGLGELRARRPGERQDRERPLQLARHKVTVRIVGNVARTEIEEVFHNDSGDTLEGIYRFPLPTDARIAKLALDVNGRMEEGSFVERERASKIWTGVIRHATPQHARVQNEEFIWVPGPWQDPALLEWKRGGRFELRVFPIPARGERRLVLAYTQTIAPHGNGRRYVYPLPHSADASTRVGQFELDARVGGAEQVNARGYQTTSTPEDRATRLSMTQNGFLPAGDLIIDYTLPNSTAEVRSWTYQGNVAAQAPARSREGEPAVVEAQRGLSADPRAFVAFAIRPTLPPWTNVQARDYVLVVDASQSMVGERYERAARIAAGLVAEMDRRDRFVVLACDATCRSMASDPRAPSSQSSNEVASWLNSIRPAGASDVVASMRAAAHALDGKRTANRDVRVIYVGDGIASVGHRRASSISQEVASIARDPRVTFTTVGIGGDSDALTLSAIARSGGGHYVPYTPGERTSAAALAVLETTYGVSLENVTLEMPAGIADLAPASIPTIRAGEEVIVTGRFAGPVRGQIVLRGKVAGRDYVDRYPIDLSVSTAAGNSFVPQLWAAKSIDQLELDGRGEDRPRIIALSKSYGVLSRHTSLLVLESEAMFQAFGVDRARPTVQWTGEDEMEVEESAGTVGHGGVTTLSVGGGRGEDLRAGAVAGSGGGGGAGYGRRGAENAGPTVARHRESRAAPARRPAAQPTAPSPAPVQAERSLAAEDTVAAAEPMGIPPVGPGRWMRRVWYRVGDVDMTAAASGTELGAVARADAALRAAPDSRDRHRDLARALERAGDLGRANEVIEKWMGRDRLDADALTALSDVLGRQGKRDEAIRLLSGIVDLEPENRRLQERLANAFDRAGMAERACAHRIAISEIETSDAAAAGAAIRCERVLGRPDGASRLLSALRDDALRASAEQAAAAAPVPPSVRGDITLDAQWSSGTDLDIALITPQGTRISWMGGRTNVLGSDASAPGHERLALRGAGTGSYIVEVSRVRSDDRTPITGRIALDILGTRRTLPFTITSDRAVVGRAVIRRESRLESAW